jgi:hypothetical protein
MFGLIRENVYVLRLWDGLNNGWRYNYNHIIQGVLEGKVNILGGYSIGHSKQKTLYEHVSYSERFPR